MSHEKSIQPPEMTDLEIVITPSQIESELDNFLSDNSDTPTNIDNRVSAIEALLINMDKKLEEQRKEESRAKEDSSNKEQMAELLSSIATLTKLNQPGPSTQPNPSTQLGPSTQNGWQTNSAWDPTPQGRSSQNSLKSESSWNSKNRTESPNRWGPSSRHENRNNHTQGYNRGTENRHRSQNDREWDNDVDKNPNRKTLKEFENIIKRERERNIAPGTIKMLGDAPLIRYNNNCGHAWHEIINVAKFHDDNVILSLALTEKPLEMKVYVIKQIEESPIIRICLTRINLVMAENQRIQIETWINVNFNVTRNTTFIPITQYQRVNGHSEHKLFVIEALCPKPLTKEEYENRKRMRR